MESNGSATLMNTITGDASEFSGISLSSYGKILAVGAWNEMKFTADDAVLLIFTESSLIVLNLFNQNNCSPSH